MSKTALETVDQGVEVKVRRTGLVQNLVRDKYLYLLLAPGIIYFVVFCYIPMWGITIAFKDFNMFKGYFASPWVGFDNFVKLFQGVDFAEKFSNTLIISSLKLLFGFPAPIILALLLNELTSLKFKKTVQTILYLPHFISWVVLAGIIVSFVNPSDGVINYLIEALGGESIDFLNSLTWFRPLLVITDVYKGVGWGTVVYLAAISGVDQGLYEAAIIDGANKFKQMWHITLPSIKNVIVVLAILSLGGILNAGFDQIFLLYNPTVYDVADTIDTYVYRRGMISADYSLATAAGLFKSVIAMILIIGTNKIAKLFGEDAVW